MARIVRFWLPIVALIVINCFTQQTYVDRSRAVRPGSFSELPFVSSGHGLSFLDAHKSDWPDTVFTDTILQNSAHIQSYYVNPSRIIFLSNDIYGGFASAKRFCAVAPCDFVAPPELFERIDRERAARARFFRALFFDFSRATFRPLWARFVYDDRASDKQLRPGSQIIEPLHESVLNRWPIRSYSATSLFSVKSLLTSQDHLVFVPSSLGTSLTMGPLESDPFYAGETFAGIGRYALLRVLAPTPHPRFELFVSGTPRRAWGRFPSAVIVGQKRLGLPLVGRGSARVFSDVIMPQTVGGMQFIGLDMGADETPLPQPKRSGLMNLYGRSVPLDNRKLTLFVRDVSLIDDQKYRLLSAPRAISHFPEDLANPNLEFSGIYEDGWASEQSYFVLQSNSKTTALRLRGMLPLINDSKYSARVCVSLDRVGLGCQTVHLGDVDLKYLLAIGVGKHEIRISFDQYQVLPGGDDRPIGMKLNFVGFESTTPRP